MVNIPKWEDAAEAVKNETASPLDLFVYHNEPAGNPQDVEFRNQLQALLVYVSSLTKRGADSLKAVVICPPKL
jgi:hypothetical protein